MLVYVWLFLQRDHLIQAFSAGYHQTHTSPTIWESMKPRKLPDPIEGLNDGQIADPNKVKTNTVPVASDILPHQFITDVVPGTYSIFSYTVLMNMWFVYLIGNFVHQHSWIN